MATKIRLKRLGRRNRPFFRIVVMDSRKRRDGAPIEELGWYDPIKRDGDNYKLKVDRILHWLKDGAKPSFTVRNLLKKEGLLHRWHLIRQGLDEQIIDQEMQKWSMDREVRIKDKAEKTVAKAKEKVKEEAEAKAEETVVEAVAVEKEEVAEEVADPIADEIEKQTEAKGVAVVIKAKHFCMSARGVKEHDSDMLTSVVRGLFREDPAIKAEFFSLLNNMKGM